MTDQPEPANDMRELYAVQHAITDGGGELTPAVHKALDALRETWDRKLRRAQAEVFQYRTALQGTARAAVLLWAADQIDAETRQLKADEVLEPDKFRPCRDASAQLRRLAAEAQQPEGECRVYAWAQTIDTIDGGRTVRIPGVHHTGSGPEVTAVIVSSEDAPVLAAMLTEAQQPDPNACTCASAGDGLVPLGHYADCPQAASTP